MSDILDHAAQVLAGATASDAERRAVRERLIAAALRATDDMVESITFHDAVPAEPKPVRFREFT